MAGSRKAFDFNQDELLILGAVGLGLYVWWSGGFANAAEKAGEGLVNAAGGLIKGGVDAVGQGVGLPALSDITTDPYVARYIMDHPAGGQIAATKYSSAAAYAGALWLDNYSGHTPPVGSKIATLFPPDAYSVGDW